MSSKSGRQVVMHNYSIDWNTDFLLIYQSTKINKYVVDQNADVFV